MMLGAVISFAFFVPAVLSFTSPALVNQQPGSRNPPPERRRPLEWGSINFLHTTDVHVRFPSLSVPFASADSQGWVEGHIKEASYSADWGDVYSFIHHMKHKAHSEGRDLLIVDTGDLHDGTGLSDTTNPDGKITDEIFKYVDFDLLSIGYRILPLEAKAGITNYTSERSQRRSTRTLRHGMKVVHCFC